MNIALLNTRILFQKSESVMDEDGNHINSWSDYYSCHTTVSGENGTETETVATTVENTDISFSVRYCSKVSEIKSTGFRVQFNDEIYNIVSIDHMNFKRKIMKFKCKKVRR